MLDVLILRDPRESRQKCSLTPIAGMSGFRIVEHRKGRRLDAGERTLLSPDGEELTSADRGRGLFLIDCAWRKVGSLLATVDGTLHARRLPPLVSAYPRRSKNFPDPSDGLASIEALFAATLILGEPRPELLEGYRWRAEFLAANRAFLAGHALEPAAPSARAPDPALP
jgi:pre-rRNA-processing protein TSR3